MNEFRIINFPKLVDPRGNLSFVQFPQQIPFEIERVFWTYDVPSGEYRGGHAYYQQEEIIIALSGSFDVVITDANVKKQTVSLNRSNYGLFVPALCWRHIENFSTNALGLHLSSFKYIQSDYIREFEVYKSIINGKDISI